ncbi:MAG: ATPase [Planctomycetota bacterium]|nr:MAG: ATPase [Planctomycetota bacterium]
MPRERPRASTAEAAGQPQGLRQTGDAAGPPAVARVVAAGGVEAASEPATAEEVQALAARLRALHGWLLAEIEQVLVGQRQAVELVLAALFAGGHVLLEGAPGLGKTLLVRTLAQALGLEFRRVQCTPDLMPADIIGTTILTEEEGGRRRFVFERGPVFAHVVLADEINRATPRTQSALLEAMQERSVTVGGVTYPLPAPFMVLATQNPIEMEGTYPLPEAQLDRFLLKVEVAPPAEAELVEVLRRTTGRAPERALPAGADAAELLALAAFARRVPCPEPVLRYAARLVGATHPASPAAPPGVRRFVRYGASPRGAQALVLVAKVRALVRGELHAAFEDIAHAAHAALRHRLLLNFEAEAEGVRPEALIDEILAAVPAVSGID